MNNIRQYIEGDEEKILPHTAFTFSSGSKQAIRAAYKSGYARLWSITNLDGAVLGIAGMYLSSPGVGDFWSLSDISVLKHRKIYAKSMRWLIGKVIEAYKLDRAQFFIRTDQVWAERWAEFLGFQKEAVLRKYADRQDHFVFAWVREDGI